MVSMSKAMSSSGAASYFEKDNYYMKDGVTEKGEWQGELAHSLGFDGEVNKVDFTALVNGYDPSKLDKDQLKQIESYAKEASAITQRFEREDDEGKVAMKSEIDQFNANKKEFDTTLSQDAKFVDDGRNIAGVREHRAGFDITFSAPKSASIAALVLGDSRIIEAHQKAVETSLNHIQEFGAQGRVWNADHSKQVKENTQSLAVAKFTHYTSRGVEGKVPDPQLHTHGFVLNMTQTSSGIKALEPRELYKMQKESGQIYQNEFAKEVEKLGYALEWNKQQNGNYTFEIKGISQELRDEFSKRTEQIETHLQKLEKSMGRELTVAEKQAYKMDVREEKQVQDINELKQNWQAQVQEKGLSVEALKQDEKLTSDARITNDTKEVVSTAIQNLESSKSVFSERDIIKEASKVSLGLSNLQEIREAITTADKITLNDGRFTTQNVLNAEKSIIGHIENGKNEKDAIISKEELSTLTSQSDTYERLTDGQKEALEHIATSKDTIIAIQGDAGTGKTASMKELNSLLGDKVDFIGLAPTGKAANELEENAGIHSMTVDKFLLMNSDKDAHKGEDLRTLPEQMKDGLASINQTLRSYMPTNFSKIDPLNVITKTAAYATGKLVKEGMDSLIEKTGDFAEAFNQKEKVFIVDESSMLGTLKMDQLLKKIEDQGGRAVFMGDVKQLNAVEQGKMFEKMQEHASTITMSEVLRQKTDETKEFASAMKDGNGLQAIECLEERNKLIINENKDKLSAEVITKASEDFIQKGTDKTIVLTANNQDKEGLNAGIREKLVDAGVVQQGRETDVLMTKSLDTFDKKMASNYNAGDILIANKHQGDLKSGGKAMVSNVDQENNRLTIQYTNGKGELKEREVSAERMNSFTAYEVDQKSFGSNDRIMFTKNDKDLDVKNGEIGTVKSFDGENMVVAKDDKEIQLSVNDYQHLTHAYAVTTHKSQGSSIDNVHIFAPTSSEMENKQAGYVEATRAKEEVTVYTDNKEQLAEMWSQEASKENAIDHFNSENNSNNLSKEQDSSSKIHESESSTTQSSHTHEDKEVQQQVNEEHSTHEKEQESERELSREENRE